MNRKPDLAGAAAITGLVLSSVGFLLFVPCVDSLPSAMLGGKVGAGCGFMLTLGRVFSIAGFIVSLCGRTGTVRALGTAFGAVGVGVSVFMFIGEATDQWNKFNG